MGNKEIKHNKLQSRWGVLKQFIQVMGVKPVHLILPVILSFLVASLEGIGVGLLIPLAKGMVGDFSVIQEIPLLNKIINILTAGLPVSLSTSKIILLTLVIMVITTLIIKNSLFYINGLVSARLYGIFHRNIYKFIFNRLLSFGKMFFDRTSQGYLNMVFDYSNKVIEFLRLTEDSINNFFTLTVYLIIMFMISWKLTLFSIVVFPIQHYCLKYIIKAIRDTSWKRNASWGIINRNVFNILSSIPLVKAYSREEQTKERFSKMNEELRLLEFKLQKGFRLIPPIQEIISMSSLLLMVLLVGFLMPKNSPSEISVFIVFFYAAKKTLPLFGIFSNFSANYSQFKPPLSEISKIFDDKDKYIITEGMKSFDGLKEKIEFTNLGFCYIRNIEVLKDLSFSVEKGKTVAIVGPTGAGKTTIINLLMRFYDCPSSAILIDGEDIRNFTLKSLRAHMALVSQEVFLFNDTIKNNMIYGLDRNVSDEELIEVAKKSHIYDFIAHMPQGFDTEVGDRGVKLSGGEKQRLSLARAFLKGSEILILDEATSSLDSKTEQLIQQAINEAIKDRTSIVIAHRLSTIKNADKIIVLDNGRVTEMGALDELLQRKGQFYELWEAQKFY